jgi:hypothetical protein
MGERERERGPPLSHYSNTFPSTRQAEKLEWGIWCINLGIGEAL